MVGLFILMFLCIAVSGKNVPSHCCTEKQVGNVTYVLVEKGDTTVYNCTENCIFEEKQKPGSRFCFKNGEQPVTCLEENGSSSDCLCGLAMRTKRIVGGVETEVNEYPWQVSLLYYPVSTVETYCGGSLISHGWILSAAHCTEGRGNVTDWNASLGEHDYESSTETDHIIVDIELILDHPNYGDKQELNFDFTLIKMKNTVDFSIHPHIRPICLPANDDNTYDNFAATVTGWGAISSGGLYSNTLQEVDVNVITNDECKNDYGYSTNEITEQMLCANVDGGGKDACQADSGGPLVTSGSGNGMTAGQNYELIGVVSWGEGCGEARHPGVYARVTKQLDWIKDTTEIGWSTCPRY